MKNERNLFDAKTENDVSASECVSASDNENGSIKPERDERGSGISSIKANRLARLNSTAPAKRAPEKKFAVKDGSGTDKPAAANKKQDGTRPFKRAERTRTRIYSNAERSEVPRITKKSSHERREAPAKKRSRRSVIHNTDDSNTPRDRKDSSAVRPFVLHKKAIIIGGILALAAACLVFLYLYTIVDEIIVEGCVTCSQAEILKQADLFTGNNIISYDLNSISERIGMIPELTILQIERVFPNKIRIVVFERTAGAAIADIGGSYTIIDDEGYVLRIGVSEPAPGLPVVVGMSATGYTINTRITQTGVDVRTSALIELISALRASDIYARIISIDISNPANVKLNVSNGFTVMLGEAVDLKTKTDRLSKALGIVERDYSMGGTLYIGDSDTVDFHPNPLPPEPSPNLGAAASPDASALPETPEPSEAPAAPDETPAP